MVEVGHALVHPRRGVRDVLVQPLAEALPLAALKRDAAEAKIAQRLRDELTLDRTNTRESAVASRYSELPDSLPAALAVS